MLPQKVHILEIVLYSSYSDTSVLGTHFIYVHRYPYYNNAIFGMKTQIVVSTGAKIISQWYAYLFVVLKPIMNKWTICFVFFYMSDKPNLWNPKHAHYYDHNLKDGQFTPFLKEMLDSTKIPLLTGSDKCLQSLTFNLFYKCIEIIHKLPYLGCAKS